MHFSCIPTAHVCYFSLWLLTGPLICTFNTEGSRFWGKQASTQKTSTEFTDRWREALDSGAVQPVLRVGTPGLELACWACVKQELDGTWESIRLVVPENRRRSGNRKWKSKTIKKNLFQMILDVHKEKNKNTGLLKRNGENGPTGRLMRKIYDDDEISRYYLKQRNINKKENDEKQTHTHKIECFAVCVFVRVSAVSRVCWGAEE